MIVHGIAWPVFGRMTVDFVRKDGPLGGNAVSALKPLFSFESIWSSLRNDVELTVFVVG